jgi:hypothetical protein
MANLMKDIKLRDLRLQMSDSAKEKAINVIALLLPLLPGAALGILIRFLPQHMGVWIGLLVGWVCTLLFGIISRVKNVERWVTSERNAIVRANYNEIMQDAEQLIEHARSIKASVHVYKGYPEKGTTENRYFKLTEQALRDGRFKSYRRISALRTEEEVDRFLCLVRPLVEADREHHCADFYVVPIEEASYVSFLTVGQADALIALPSKTGGQAAGHQWGVFISASPEIVESITSEIDSFATKEALRFPDSDADWEALKKQIMKQARICEPDTQ